LCKENAVLYTKIIFFCKKNQIIYTYYIVNDKVFGIFYHLWCPVLTVAVLSDYLPHPLIRLLQAFIKLVPLPYPVADAKQKLNRLMLLPLSLPSIQSLWFPF